jgi:general secretion pathway protein L
MKMILGGIRVATLTTAFGQLWEWWLKEFVNLFPERTAEWLSGRGRTMLLLAANQEGSTLELLNSAHTTIASERVAPTGDTLAQINRFLRSQGIEPSDTDIGLQLPADSVFSRQLLLPAEAMGAIDAIVAQDLANKTPFKPEDVYSDHAADRGDGGKVVVRQWIVRRRYVDHALSLLKIDIERLAFIMFDGDAAERRPAPFINLRPTADARNAWFQKTVLALCCCAVVLAALAGGLKYWQQQIEMDRLATQIAATGNKAQLVRALVDQLQEKKSALLHLRLQRSQVPGLIDLWDEVTRVLPSHSWLTELRLLETANKREEQVGISGFSSAAPSLVGIIDGSQLFFDAALTSPIAFDSTEGRERFALQVKVKMPDMLKEAKR